MRHGAVEFLTKPFREHDLLDAIRRGIERHREARQFHQRFVALRKRLGTLTAREHDVLVLVVKGFPNKHIAAALNVTEATVKVHRGQVMRKMDASSLSWLPRRWTSAC